MRPCPPFIRSWGGLLLSLAVVLFAGEWAPAVATRPKVWQQQTYEQFAAGKATGIAIDQDGILHLAPALERFVDLEVERIWSLAVGPDGTLYAGTGDQGKLFAVTPKGQIRLLLDSPEVAIHALAVGADRRLYAGTAPDGLIYALDLANDRVTTLAHTESHYVWDLAFDSRGRLHAATGEPGKIVALSSTGKVETQWDLPDRHVRALQGTAGRFYASTAQEGRIYELSSAGTSRLLFAAPGQEVHALAVAAGMLYAAALSQPEAKEGAEPASAVYRLDPAGAVVPVWEESGVALIDLAADQDEGLILASLRPTCLYRLDQEERQTLLCCFDELHPGCLLSAGDGIWYLGAAQSGEILRLSRDYCREGQFDSAVEDFGAHARWGTIEWRADLPAGTRLRVQTRSGNCQTPDTTWSPWSEVVEQSGRPIASPPARYLQYRVVLQTGDPRRTPYLQDLRLTGQQFNLRPEIGQLEIVPYRNRQRGGDGSQEQVPPSAGAEGRPRPPFAKSLYLVRWQASDPNGDELVYRLYLRGIEEKEWKLIEEEIAQTSVVWDTETMPEGLVLLRLIASDQRDNPEGTVMEAERISAPFPIDHSPPQVELQVRDGREPEIEVEAKDRITSIRKIQYTVDYGDQVRQVGALDGLFDSRQEKARFVVQGLSPGEHVIAVQAWDELDNVGTRQVVVQIK